MKRSVWLIFIWPLLICAQEVTQPTEEPHPPQPTEEPPEPTEEPPEPTEEPPEPTEEPPEPTEEPPEPTEMPEENYDAIGCFKDRPRPRALPELIANFRSQIDWNDLTKTVHQCAQAAKAKGYTFFAVQFYGECFSGKDAGLTYDMYGPSDDCTGTVGRHWTNFVYRFTS